MNNDIFYITKEGILFAKNATVSGTVGGFIVEGNAIRYGKTSYTDHNSGFFLSPDGLHIDSWYFNKNGEVRCYSINASYGIYTSSDEKLKDNIKLISSQKELSEFFDDLNPVTFKYNSEGENAPLHIGFIANEVEENLKKHEIAPETFSPCEEDEDGILSLRYQDFIALNIAETQQLKAEVEELKSLLKEDFNEG